MKTETALTTKKRRAVHLMAQGWSAKATAADTGLKEQTIESDWREWARQLEMEVPERTEPPMNPPGPVTTYSVLPEGEPSPVPSPKPRPKQAKKPDKHPLPGTPPLSDPTLPFLLLDEVFRLVRKYAADSHIPMGSVCCKVELAEGDLVMTLALPMDTTA